MTTSNFLIFSIASAAHLLMGLCLRLNKHFFLSQYQRRNNSWSLYSVIPLGLMEFVLVLVSLLPQEIRQTSSLFIMISTLIGTVVLIKWPPKWLKPTWISTLEASYGVEETKTMLHAVENRKEWEKRVRTQEGLEAWAKEAWQQLQAERGANGRGS